MKSKYHKGIKKVSGNIIALIFIVAGTFKIYSFQQFISDVQRFDVIPLTVVLPFSALIVFIELIAGIGLILNINTKLFSVALIILLVIFTGGIIINLFRGNILDCGCFGSTFLAEIGWWSVMRNMILGATLYWAFLQGESFRHKL